MLSVELNPNEKMKFGIDMSLQVINLVKSTWCTRQVGLRVSRFAVLDWYTLCRSYWQPNRRYHRTKWMPWWQPGCLKYPLEWVCCLVLEFYHNTSITQELSFAGENTGWNIRSFCRIWFGVLRRTLTNIQHKLWPEKKCLSS